MTPMQAIKSATGTAARYMGWDDRVGALLPGRYGDLVAVRADPLRDVSVLERIDVVVKGGRVIKSAGVVSGDALARNTATAQSGT